MPDLVNLSLFAALKLSHCSSDDALDVLVKSLTNGFDSEPAFEPRILKRTRGSLDRVKKPPTADKAFQDCLKDPFLVGAPKMVCFICKKKKQFWCVRCKVAFHSKCAAWSDSVLQLKDHPGHTVCWRHPYDWHLDWKWKYIKMPDLPFQVGDLAESRCFEKVVIVVHGLDASYQNNLLNIYRDRGKAAAKGFSFRSEGAKVV
ncbi:hypothetical protein JHK85_039133 [Glycine max]|nr:hypothetical protein JHK85_039133 [Glycine max]KAG4979094.1 hypothetical protein JHK86_038568 [Glycine max]